MGCLWKIMFPFMLLIMCDETLFVRSFTLRSTPLTMLRHWVHKTIHKNGCTHGDEIIQVSRKMDNCYVGKEKRCSNMLRLSNVVEVREDNKLSDSTVLDKPDGDSDIWETTSCGDYHGDSAQTCNDHSDRSDSGQTCNDHSDSNDSSDNGQTYNDHMESVDLFENDCLQLKQWYSGERVKEKWKEKHIENVRSNYEKVLLNNKYNELFNMYRNIKKNNVENYKKRVKTNRINPVIYVKKRLVSATAKYIKMSFIKTRKILWKIRYMPIIKAFAFLYYYGTNKYTVNIYKCIKSCLFNAINKYGKNNIKPVFHTLQANMGGYTKKINIRAKGKTDIIREPHTHIRVVLEV
ncbi:50S ribosomal protein L22, apicoplast [Plasmodium gonderi]|uniref:50S ribosomal protein L22, apicoplast n=1 Tax=Plasmodium gonderi TaxID=77519 RepID=A0A1Y1JIQ4_PLAGO|nr:50S ribosomal protein L22, apicoplast [Plasmodium gonderi]GAW82411.1 50S ribosomal protein L22, apicoplast [Plasmodium gonderi]